MKTAVMAVAFAATLSLSAAPPLAAIEMPAFELAARSMSPGAEGAAIELRHYPSMQLALADGEGGYNRFHEDQAATFAHLFRYIRGHNEGETRIEMTTPVFVKPSPADRAVRITADDVFGAEFDPANVMERSDAWTMAFFLPTRLELQGAPVPLDSSVRIDRSAPMTVAAIRFAGHSNDDAEAFHLAALRHWIRDNGLRETGSHWLGFYDHPATPGPLRRNEILIPVEPVR